MDRKSFRVGLLAVFCVLAVALAVWQYRFVPLSLPKEPETAGQEARWYVLADDGLDNLTIPDVRTPVFDSRTLAERRALGLPTQLPAIAEVHTDHVAYLTFDDGPDERNTPIILDILKTYGVPATFYVTGKMSEKHPEVLKRIFAEHHAIGNHSYDHVYKNLYPNPQDFLAEMEKTDEIIYGILGVRPFILRAPGGSWGMFTPEYGPLLVANGYVEHDWNVSSQDAAGGELTAAELVANVDAQTDRVKNAIILMHSTAGKDSTAAALPAIIELLVKKGFTFGVVTPMTPHP